MIKNTKCKQTENIINGKLKHEGNIFNVKMTVGSGMFFVFENSLPKGLIPKIGDKILWNFEVDHFNVKDVIPLIVNGNKLSNYTLVVDID